MKKIIFTLSIILLSASLFAKDSVKYAFNAKRAVKDKGNSSFNKTISAVELVQDMKTGWNLGNTMDANGSTGLESETSWGQPLATKAQIDGLVAAGFKTIRIPCSWKNHLVDSNYTIDPEWMKRVKTIVDWAIADGMYVILNDHHDNFDTEGFMHYGDGYYPSSLNYNESMRFLRNLWAQISLAFNSGYDEHLIFEVLNEPRLRGHSHEWNYMKNCTTCKNGAQTLNKLNQLCLDTIRASGKNNANRFVMVTGLAAAMVSYTADDSWGLPVENGDNKLIISVHMYSPYPFAMQNPGIRDFSENLTAELEFNFKWLADKYVSRGIPVVIGEYGATNKDNLEDRVKWFSYFIHESRKYGMCSVLWDNGDWNPRNTYEEKFGFYNRTEQKWYFPEIVDAIMNNVD